MSPPKKKAAVPPAASGPLIGRSSVFHILAANAEMSNDERSSARQSAGNSLRHLAQRLARTFTSQSLSQPGSRQPLCMGA